MKTISFLIGNLSNSGGTQRMLTLLCNELIEKFTIIVFIHQEGCSFFELDERVKIVVLKGNLIQHNFQIYRCLKSTNTKYYINLDSNSVLLNGFLLPSFTKLIVWEHFSLEHNFQKWLFTLSRMYAAYRTSAFVVLSNFEKELWNSRYKISLSKIEIINNPISIHPKNITHNNNWRNKSVIAIGNDIKIKGFDLLLQAWKKIDSLGELTIVGLPLDEQNQLRDQIAINNIKNVHLLGRVKDMFNLYKQATVFVLSSRKEAAPLVLIESQAFGIPVVNFDHIQSVNEMVEDSTLLVKFDESNPNLDNAIKSLLSNESVYNEYQHKSIENSKKFSIQKFKEQWVKLLAK